MCEINKPPALCLCCIRHQCKGVFKVRYVFYKTGAKVVENQMTIKF